MIMRLGLLRAILICSAIVASVIVGLAVFQPARQGGRLPVVEAGAIEEFPRALTLPVKGVVSSDIEDTFNQSRGTERQHEATDIMAPRGTPVVAVDDGTIEKLFLSEPGGNTIYQFDPTDQYAYYYAHLDGYAPGIHEGMTVKRGDVLGYVGSTGNAPQNTPHLHFGIFELGPEKRWWEGTPINPYPILMRTIASRTKSPRQDGG
jgi:peptidoglycan LD-endopeptidase LytH